MKINKRNIKLLQLLNMDVFRGGSNSTLTIDRTAGEYSHPDVYRWTIVSLNGLLFDFEHQTYHSEYTEEQMNYSIYRILVWICEQIS